MTESGINHRNMQEFASMSILRETKQILYPFIAVAEIIE